MNVVWFELQIYKHKHFSAVYFSLNEKSLVCENVQQRRRWAFIDASPWGSRSDLEVASLVPNFQLVWQLSGGYLVFSFRGSAYKRSLTLSSAGGGWKTPPLSYFCDSPKKINGKSCQFFFTFPKYEIGRLGTTFCSQITFSVVGRGLKLSNMPQFHKGGPCRE